MRLFIHIACVCVPALYLGVGLAVAASGDCPYTGDEGLGLRADFNEDCYVNLADFGIFAQQWLECRDIDNPDCVEWFDNRRGHRLFVTKVYPGQGSLTHSATFPTRSVTPSPVVQLP